MISLKDRFFGSILGMAIGDALGAPLEFRYPGSFEPVTGMTSGTHDLKPGQWTDDTSMGLCLAESLIESKGFDPTDQMRRYLMWRNEGRLSSTGYCFDIGMATSSALQRFEREGNPYAGSTDKRSAGNGSIMRLAAVPLRFCLDPEEALRYSAESSRTTHGARTCVDACRYMGGLIVGAVRGQPKERLLSRRYCPLPDEFEAKPLCPEIDEIACGSFAEKDPPEIIGSGYVVKSLEAALWAFFRTDSFRDGCLAAVNLGRDADTTAAVYGQIAGAYYGVGGIPSEWLEQLWDRPLIEGFAEKLYNASGAAAWEAKMKRRD